MRTMRLRVLSYIGIVGISILSASLLMHWDARALSGTGYFTGDKNTCSLDSGGGRGCPENPPDYASDVIKGRPGVARVVPNGFGTNKYRYRDWLVNLYYGSAPGSSNRQAAQFIIATMLGSSSQGDNVSELVRRFDNPALTMRESVEDPDKHQPISYRGRTTALKNDFFYSSAWHGTEGNMYVFSTDGGRTIAYMLEEACGNPVGNVSGLPAYNPENWSISATSGIKQLPGGSYENGATINNGKIGQTYSWSHSLKNNGPTDMLSTVEYFVKRQGFSDSSYNNVYGQNNAPYSSGAKAKNGQYIYNKNGENGGPYMSYTIKPGDGGHTLCQDINAFPGSTSVNGWVASSAACVNVPFNYTLTPTIAVDPNYTIVESPASTYTVTGTVKTNGTWSAPDTKWYLVRIHYDPGQPDPVTGAYTTGGTSNQAPCDYFKGGSSVYSAGGCNASWQSGGGQVPDGSGVSFNGPNPDSFTNLKVGERLCYATAVTKPTQKANPVWGYSELKCIVAAKRPRIQVWGGDVRVGSDYFGPTIAMGANDDNSSIITGHTDYTSNTKGSWGEYGLFAPTNGTITSFSGGALSGKVGAPLGVPNSTLNMLTFSNTDSAAYGHFAPPAAVSGLVQGLTSRASTMAATATNIDIGTITGSASDPKTAVVDVNSGNVNISGTLSPSLTTLIIRSTGGKTLHIGKGAVGGASNLLIGNRPFASASGVPQIIIVASNIVIDSDVSQVDAWLVAVPEMAGGAVAYGSISTCDDIVTPYYKDLYAGGPCDKNPLVINGPVIARELQLRRTNGEDPVGDARTSSEVINMRPDAYLWATAQASTSGRMDTVMTTELPPRF